MECLGFVETVSRDSRFVVRTEAVPELNTPVYDSEGKKIGSVKRIFGPIEEPYVTVIADDVSVLTNIVGKKIYHKGKAKNVKNKRRH